MRIKLVVIILIWTAWAGLTYWISRDTFDEFLITSRSGIAENGKCEFSRTNTTLELTIQYEGDDEKTNETIFLPLTIRCDDDLLSRIVGRNVTVTDYKKHTLGIAAKGDIIMDFKDNLWSVESNDHLARILTFLAFASSFVVIIKGPHKRSQYRWLARIRDRWNK